VSDSVTHSRKFHTLDGLRGIAALGVVGIHANPWISSFAPASTYLAVDLFFLLSGFVLAHAYERRFASGMTMPQFLVIRLIRLYPLFLLSVLWAAASALYQLHRGVFPISIRGIGASSFTSLLMLPTPIVRAKSWLFPLNPPAWSLCLELVVNIVYALAWRRLTNRALMGIVGVSAAALVAVSVTQAGLDAGPYFQSAALGFVRLSFSFFLGVLLRRWKGPGQARSQQPWIARGLLLALLAIMITQLDGSARASFDLICALLVFPAMIWIGATYEPATRLEKQICASLGLASYAIYLLHYPVLSLIARCAPHFVHRWVGHPYAVDAVLMASFWAAAVWVDRYYDVPIRRWLTRLHSEASNGKRPRATTPHLARSDEG